MAEYLTPGVYVQETSSRYKTIDGVNTHITAFIGPTRRGPQVFAEECEASPPELLTSFAEFEQIYGGLDDLPSEECQPSSTNFLAHAARVFFDEGGQRLYIFRTSDSSSLASYQRALHTIESLPEISIIAAPGNIIPEIADALLAYAERASTYCFVVLDSPPGLNAAEVLQYRRQFDSNHAAMYYPWVIASNGQDGEIVLPPSGFLCGIYARVDVQRGVHKAPANEVIGGALGLEHDVNSAEQELLNPQGVNCLRFFEGRGFRVWGARTLSRDPEWKYVNVRRYFNYLQASIERGVEWTKSTANSEVLWANIDQMISDFMLNEWRHGRLAGSKVEEGFFVRCDRSTMTQQDINEGRLVCLVGVAVLKPAEFVVLRLLQQTALSST